MVEIYQLRFFLKGISPLIWRRLLVKSTSSLADLHYIIQISMGWSDSHLHKFEIWGKEYGLYYEGGISFSDDATEVYLQDFQFRINETFAYEYNFFDHWEHEIRLEKILPFNSKKLYPFCMGGNYVCPPEDCGGPLSFMKLRDHYSIWKIEEKLLEAIEQYKVAKDWDFLQENVEELQYWAVCNKFDRQKINLQLQRYFSNNKENQLTVEEVQDED